MKKFYLFLIMLLSVIAPQAADAFSITINVDDASRLNVFLNGYKDLVNGDNVVEVNDGDYLSIWTKQNDVAIKSVFNGDKELKLESYSSFNLKLSENDHTGAKFVVKTATVDEMRTASCKVTVDDASKVTLYLPGTYSTLSLKDGENEVKFIPGTESVFTVKPINLDAPLYKVTHNSVVAEAVWNSYTLKNVADGDVIDIQANYPDIDCAVKFNINAEGVGAIKSVTVNGNEVTNYMDNNFTVKCGSTVSIMLNSEDYKLESFKVNGEDKIDNVSSSYDYFVTDATTFDITAKKYTTFKATIDIDDVSHATVYKGYSYYGDAFDMKNGKNEIEVSEQQPLIALVAKDGYYFTSVNDGTTEYTDKSVSEINITVVDGIVLKVVTATIVRDKKALVYVDDRSATSSLVFSRGDNNRIEIGTGYNELEFYKGDNPFSITVYASTKKVYKNDVAVDPANYYGSYYNFNLADGDVVKMFFTKIPAMVKADITANGGAENLSVVKDRIQPVADFSAGISCLEDTELAFAAKEGYSIKALTVDGTAATAEADGTYKVVVKADANIVVDLQTASGISSVTTADANSTANVYNANGVLVLKNATPEQTAKLAKGLYIINGKKVVR